MEVFLTDPSPLSTRQRQLVWVTAAFVALTRLFAVSASLWDWDEAQFGLALRDYNVARHQPHPPGFPIYVALAKIALLVTTDEIRACQLVVVAAAMFLFPLAFLLGREVRLPFSTAYSGALVFVFLPNIWFYGGTAFSDIPGTALILAACVLLLRGCRDLRALAAGAVLLGMAAGVRPQALLMGCWPSLLATWLNRAKWRRVALAAGAGALVLIGSYAGAALATESVDAYFGTLKWLGRYVREVDSFRNPQREALMQLAEDVFIRPVRAGLISYAVFALALVGAITAFVRRQPSRMLVAVFFPFALFAWLMLDPFSVGRYATGYLVMYALLAAAGASLLGRLGTGLMIFLAGAMLVWALPAIIEVRTSSSPPVAALKWACNRTGRMFIHEWLLQHSTFLLGNDARVTFVRSPDDEALRDARAEDVYITEGVMPLAGVKVFSRERGVLWHIARQRYFEVTVAPARSVPVFVRGWHKEKESAGRVWRWMGRRSETTFQGRAGKVRLSLAFRAAVVEGRRPEVAVLLNGVLVDRFTAQADFERREWLVAAHAGDRNRLVITTDRAFTTRRGEFGLRVEEIGWTPIDGS